MPRILVTPIAGPLVVVPTHAEARELLKRNIAELIELSLAIDSITTVLGCTPHTSPTERLEAIDRAAKVASRAVYRHATSLLPLVPIFAEVK